MALTAWVATPTAGQASVTATDMRGAAAAAAAAIILAVASLPTFAWEGYDHEHSASVEIEKGNLVREGREIEVYDSEAGYRTFEVQSIERYGSSVEIEVTDTESGETRTFEMEND